MWLKLLTVFLAIMLTVESFYILKLRHPTNRFKPVEGYDGLVAFDTGTGQLCKTLRTKTAAEIEKLDAEAAKKPVPCPSLPAPSGDPGLDEINRASISKKCGGNGEDVDQKSDDTAIEFIAQLPACADIR
jgi:hypothetical protein